MERYKTRPTKLKSSFQRIKRFWHFNAFPDVKVYINARTTLPTELDHNYGFDLSNFKRVISKHMDKIPFYK